MASENANSDVDSSDDTSKNKNPRSNTGQSGRQSTEFGDAPDDQYTLSSVAGGNGDDNTNDQEPTDDAHSVDDSVGDEDGLKPPTPPANLPQYLVDPLQRQSLDDLHTVQEFVSELIKFEGSLTTEQPATDIEELKKLEAESLRQMDDEELEQKGSIIERKVKCGRDGCQCSSGDEDDMHGPYKYLYFRDTEGVVLNKYIGKA